MKDTIEITNWLVYGLHGNQGLLVADDRIPVFSTTIRAKAFRAARPDRAGFTLAPMLLDEVKAHAAARNRGVAVNPEPDAVADVALAAEPAGVGC